MKSVANAFLPLNMQKKNNKIGHRSNQRQKLNRKMILIIAASFMGCMIAALTIFLKTSRVDESRASGNTYMVSEEVPVTEMTLDAPILKSTPEPEPNTLLVRAVKHDKNTGMNANH